MVDLWVMVGCWFYMEKRGCWVCAAFCLASCAYCGLSSMPVALRLSLIAVVMVVPEPAKGSSVVPGLVVVLQLHVGMKPVVVMICATPRLPAPEYWLSSWLNCLASGFWE